MSFGNRLLSLLSSPRSDAAAKENCGQVHDSFLRCPFCQGISILIRKKTSEKDTSYQAKCSDCRALGPLGDSPGEAKAFWNERLLESEAGSML